MAEDSIHVVFLANDVVYRQAIAFLESFRTYNPDLRLSLIPFADDLFYLEKLGSLYRFDVVTADPRPWDELSKEVFPGAPQKYANRLRKLLVFDVKAPTTVYVDIDTLVLRDMKFLAEYLLADKSDFLCVATGNDPWVYNESYKNHSQFARAKRFSDGFFALRSDLINGPMARQLLDTHRNLYLSVRAPQVYCQPITNFIVDMLGLRVNEVSSVFPFISGKVWYAADSLTSDGPRVKAADGREVLFVHWAGPVEVTGDVPLGETFLHYLNLAKARIDSAGLPLPPALAKL